MKTLQFPISPKQIADFRLPYAPINMTSTYFTLHFMSRSSSCNICSSLVRTGTTLMRFTKRIDQPFNPNQTAMLSFHNYDFFYRMYFFPKKLVESLGCGLSAGAAYLRVNTVITIKPGCQMWFISVNFCCSENVQNMTLCDFLMP